MEPTTRDYVGAVLAREPLQRFWELVLFTSMSGLGYQNAAQKINGEDRYLRKWLQRNRDRTPVLFDVGCFEGEFTDIVLSDHRTAIVHAFEPNPRAYEALTLKYKSNPRVVLNSFGLSDEQKVLSIYDHYGDKPTCQSTFVKEVIPVEDIVEVGTSRTERLDTYCSEREIEHVDYLKVDVEGYEKLVFQGAGKLIAAQKIGYIHFEQNQMALMAGFSLAEIIHTLPRYDIYRFIPHGLVPVATRTRPYRWNHDFFRYHNLMAIKPNMPV